MTTLVLASGSKIRRTLLQDAGLAIEVNKPLLDEEAIKAAMLAEGAPPRDIADILAQEKALKISRKFPDATVLGCDQVLDFNGTLLSKPASPDDVRAQLRAMRGKRHSLLSAAVICEGGKPIWRHIGQVRLTMRDFSDSYLDSYISRNWDEIRHCVGGYMLEKEGVRLFSRIEGDYFNVLGLPMIELMNYLTIKGVIDG